MIDRDQVARAVAGLSAMFQGDGAALQLTALDEQLGTVELTLALHQVECADCVLPPGRLRDVIDGTLRRDVPGVRRLVLTDPREARPPARAPVQGPGAVITVLDPVGEIAPGNPDPGPDAGLLAARRIGFRVDLLCPPRDRPLPDWTARLTKVAPPA